MKKNLNSTKSEVVTITSIGSNLFVGTYKDGVFLTTDNGDSWIKRDTGLSNTGIRTIVSNGNNLFVGTYGGGLFVSTDYGNNWLPKNTGLSNLMVLSLTIDNNFIFSGTSGDIFLSTDNGNNWEIINSGLPPGWMNTLLLSKSYVFIGSNKGVFRSKLIDFGITAVTEKKLSNDEFNIFPNPSESEISINFPSKYQSGIIKVYSIEGNEILNIEYKDKIDLSCFVSGIYFLIVRDKIFKFEKY